MTLFQVKIGDCLFHAIQQNFLTGIEIILKHDDCRGMSIEGENCYFPVGSTPMIHAACCNNYDALKLLQNHDHILEVKRN